MRTEHIKKMLNGQVFFLDQQTMESLEAFLNSGAEANNTIKTANKSVEYSEYKNIGIVAIDGATYKKEVQGLCMTVASYEQMATFAKQADANPEIDTTLFRVSSHGGSVEGLDELAKLIPTLKNKTVTYFEDNGQSAAIYYGTASDEVYAGETTKLGSIGAVVSFTEKKDSETVIKFLTSKNAKNKVCNIADKECLGRIQRDIDKYEGFFYAALKRNRGLSEEEIKEKLNYGDSVFAQEALEIKLIDDIITFDALLLKLTGETMVKEKTKNTKQTITQETQEPTVNMQDIAELIQAKMSAVPIHLMGDKDVIAYASNPEISLNDFKAKLFDMGDKAMTKQKTVEANANQQLQEIDSSTKEADSGADDEAKLEAEGADLLKEIATRNEGAIHGRYAV